MQLHSESSNLSLTSGFILQSPGPGRHQCLCVFQAVPWQKNIKGGMFLQQTAPEPSQSCPPSSHMSKESTPALCSPDSWANALGTKCMTVCSKCQQMTCGKCCQEHPVVTTACYSSELGKPLLVFLRKTILK